MTRTTKMYVQNGAIASTSFRSFQVKTLQELIDRIDISGVQIKVLRGRNKIILDCSNIRVSPEEKFGR